MATQRTQDKENQIKHTMKYVIDNTICKQTKHAPSYKHLNTVG